MRQYPFALFVAVLASPAVAQQAPQPQQIQVPPQLKDPEFAKRLGAMTQALGKALLDMPIGEIQAAAEGRPATRADRRRTVRDLGRQSDPQFDQNFHRQIAEAGPMLQSSMEALASALPAMTKAMTEMAREMERAVKNMPRPDYPRR